MSESGIQTYFNRAMGGDHMALVEYVNHRQDALRKEAISATTIEQVKEKKGAHDELLKIVTMVREYESLLAKRNAAQATS